MGCSLPGFSIHGIFQARVLEWVAISFPRGSSWHRDWYPVSRTAGRCFILWATREAPSIQCYMSIISRINELKKNFLMQFPIPVSRHYDFMMFERELKGYNLHKPNQIILLCFQFWEHLCKTIFYCLLLPNNSSFGLQNHCRWWLQPWYKKTLAPWKKSYDKPRQHIREQRHHSAQIISHRSTLALFPTTCCSVFSATSGEFLAAEDNSWERWASVPLPFVLSVALKRFSGFKKLFSLRMFA